MMSILRSTLVCSVVQWTMSVKLVNLAGTERERWWSESPKKRKSLFVYWKVEYLLKFPSFGVHVICMNNSIRKRG
jgi:hypothetical protein